ncbi:MAG: hypothetical protein V4710_09000 [Verrucomicrobiota bacterium]
MEERTVLQGKAGLKHYLTEHALRVNPRDLREVLATLPRLRHRAREVDLSGFPFLPAQLELLSNALEAFASGVNEEIPLSTAAEIVVAISLLALSLDESPFSNEESNGGPSIVALLLQRHRRALKKFAATKGISWSLLEPEPFPV